jgi:hypothetical protein
MGKFEMKMRIEADVLDQVDRSLLAASLKKESLFLENRRVAIHEMSQSPEIVLIKQADGKFRLKKEVFSHTSSTDETKTYCAFNTKRLDSSIPELAAKLDLRKAEQYHYRRTAYRQAVASVLVLAYP